MTTAPLATIPELEATVAEQLPFVTARISTKGFFDPAWTGFGTGFFWQQPLRQEDQTLVLLITNRHVLANKDVVGLNLHSPNSSPRRIGGPGVVETLAVDEKMVVFHPDPAIDLAVIVLGPLFARLERENGQRPFYKGLDPSLLPTDDEIQDLSAVQQVLTVGYPSGLYDAANNLPVVRRGTTAVPPWVEYGGKSELLLDVPMFPGSSGSPVFVLEEGMVSGRGGIRFGGQRVHFMGVLHSAMFMTDRGTITANPIPTALNQFEIRQWLSLGVAVKAARVRELVAHTMSEFRLEPPGDGSGSGTI